MLLLHGCTCRVCMSQDTCNNSSNQVKETRLMMELNVDFLELRTSDAFVLLLASMLLL